MNIRNKLIFGFFVVAFAGVPNPDNMDLEYNYSPSVARDDNPLPTNPLLDRAKGFLLNGKLKSAISNYGSIVDGFSHHPGGLWGEYSYFPSISFMYSIPGHKYSHMFEWELVGIADGYPIWKSEEAGYSWIRGVDSVFVDFVFNVVDDKGDLGTRFGSYLDFNSFNQWSLEEDESGNLSVYITTMNEQTNPNFQEGRMGLVYPWAKRAKFVERDPEVLYDFYDYGPDAIPWTEDDNWEYYGASSNESWFTRASDNANSDWQPKYRARELTHSSDFSIGEIFGGASDFTDSGDPYPVLAHSNFSDTWPKEYNAVTGEYERVWPGWWAEVFDSSLANCNGNRKDDDCWYENVGDRFISDTDVYMEFDDRWAHQGNYVSTAGDEYVNTGYPLGITVRMEAHSYGVSFAEDIMFITVRVLNESGDYINEDGEFVEGMVMPDGSKINGGKGFDYERSWMGFYIDVDAVWADYNGGFGSHTNADDAMGYYRDKPPGGEDSLSFAYIYDFDGVSNSAVNTAYAAVQLLDSPRLPDYEEPLDFNQDGNPDVFPGDKLGMTDWHWFDWYNRPGVRTRESNTNCCDGTANRPSSANREEIQYKIMSGDTVNVSNDEQVWFFHTSDPQNEVAADLNPHFDSMDGLQLTDFWQEGEDGMDCVLIMSTGPFELKVGEEKPFSFCVIMGENLDDLIKNAQFAQIMYDSHYQGFTAPDIPVLSGTAGHEKVTLYWQDNAESSLDVVTRYADFEGYKLYKSDDGGMSWGDPIIVNGSQVGWEPIAQWDLSYEEDVNHCIFSNSTDCDDDLKRGAEVSGYDTYEGHEWFYLGSNTGLQYTYVDTNVFDGVEYSYSLTSYDTGLLPPYSNEYILNDDGTYTLEQDSLQSNPNGWADPDGAAALESARGTTVLDPNFVKVTPGHQASNYSEPDVQNGDIVFVDGSENFGTGEQFFRIVNPYQFEDDILKFKMSAELDSDSDAGDLEGFKTNNPRIFSYLVDSEGISSDYNAYDVDELTLDSLNMFLAMPGVVEHDTLLMVPNYIENSFTVSSDVNFTDAYAGLVFGFTNIVEYSDLTLEEVGFPGVLHSVDGTSELYEKVFNSKLDNIEEEVNSFTDFLDSDLMFMTMEYYNENAYNYSPVFDYSMEFSSDLYLDALDEDGCNEQDGVWNSTTSECYYSVSDNMISGGCDSGVKSILPFRVRNVQTGKIVKLTHSDKGITNDGSIFNSEVEGYKDCIWNKNERITFTDSVRVGESVSYEEIDLFNLYLDYNTSEAYQAACSGGCPVWDGTGPYEYGDRTYYNGLEYVYIANESNISEPGVLGDSDGDGKPDYGVSNVNPWMPVFPWSTTEGVLILTPVKKYVDGDSWMVDLSRFGELSSVTEESLEEIRVVPNPYIVRSGFNNEDEYHNYLRFTHLPTNCTIKIYTVSGEYVQKLEHNDIVDGNEYWNLRNRFNQLIAPGLYIYSVESEGKKHLGKFAVVR